MGLVGLLSQTAVHVVDNDGIMLCLCSRSIVGLVFVWSCRVIAPNNSKDIITVAPPPRVHVFLLVQQPPSNTATWHCPTAVLRWLPRCLRTAWRGASTFGIPCRQWIPKHCVFGSSKNPARCVLPGLQARLLGTSYLAQMLYSLPTRKIFTSKMLNIYH